MTVVHIKAGICGFAMTISAEKTGDEGVRIALQGGSPICPDVEKLVEDIAISNVRDVFKNSPVENPVLRAARRRIKHLSCIVPAAIFKAIEVELGLALKGTSSINFG